MLAFTLGLSGAARLPLYHHPAYNLPVYPPWVYNAQLSEAYKPQKAAVTTYARKENVHFMSLMCQVDHREVAKMWDAFDTNTDGLIGFNEINTASQCYFPEDCGWLAIMSPEILRRAVHETDDGACFSIDKIWSVAPWHPITKIYD